MISRRNIRVKVMQLLYIIETAEEGAKLPNPVQVLKKQLDLSNELFVYLLYFITEVARYAETSAFNRAARNLPSNDDLNVNTKIAGNSLLWEIIESETYKEALEVFKPHHTISKDLLKKTFNALADSDIYQLYTASDVRDKAKEKEIIKFIFTNLMLPNEAFIEHIEEVFHNWDDDADMMEQLVLNYIQKPAGVNILEMVGTEKWQFAQTLLETTIDKKEVAADLIKPKLKNWDAERIALLDMILI